MSRPEHKSICRQSVLFLMLVIYVVGFLTKLLVVHLVVDNKMSPDIYELIQSGPLDGYFLYQCPFYDCEISRFDLFQ